VNVVDARIEVARDLLARDLHLVGEIVLSGNRIGGERTLFRQLRIDYSAIGETKMKERLGDEAKVSVEDEISTLAFHGEDKGGKSGLG
jgi:hypothetical protein